MKKIVTIGILLGLSLVPLKSQSLGERVLEAIKYMQNSEFDKAIEKYDSIITDYPNNPTIYLLKGEAYTQLKRVYVSDSISYEKARICFNKALEIDSTMFEAYRSLGVLNIFNQKFERARDNFTRAIQYSPTNDDLFNSLTDRGAAYIYLEEYDNAIKDYEEASKLKPDEIGLYSNLSMIYKNLGDLVKARELCEKGLEISKDDEILLNNLGLIEMEEGKYVEAEEIYNVILKRNKSNAFALSNRGLARTKLEKYKLAEEDLNNSITLYPENSYAYKIRAILYIELDKTKEACEDLLKSKELGYGNMYGSEVDELLKDNCN